jgi:integrase
MENGSNTLRMPPPWRDAATIIRGTGMRPGEVFSLRWENLYLNGSAGLIQITEGKTKAAKGMLPMVPSVYSALKSRHEASGKSESGCVFPSSSAEGHFNKDAAKDQHAKAIGKADQKAGKAKYRKLLVRRGDSNPHGFTRQIRTLHAKLPRGDALWRNTGRVRLAPLRSIRTSLARIATPK